MPLNDPISRIQQKRQSQSDANTEQARNDAIINAVKETGGQTTDALSNSMRDLLMATIIGKDPKLAEVASNLAGLLESIVKASNKVKNLDLEVIPEGFGELLTAIKQLPDNIENADKSPELIPYLENINKTIQSKNTSPTVNLPDLTVDLKPIEKLITSLEKTIKASKVDIPKSDFTALEDSVKKVEDAIKGLHFPVSNYVLPFKNTQGAATQVILDGSGNVPVSVISGGGGGTQYAEGITTAPATGTVALGRYNTSAPTLTNGQLNAPQLDVNSNLKIVPASVTLPVQLNASQTTTTGSITTSTTTVTATDLAGVGAVTVSIYGTYAGVNVTFEVNDGVNWVSAVAVPLSVANPTPVAGATGVLTTNSTNVWNVSPLLGIAQFRVRATAFGSGSASVRIEPSAQFTQPNVVVTSPTAANMLVTATVASTTITSLVPGVTATSLGKAEDAAHASGDTGVAIWGVANIGAATTFAANGDYTPHAVDVQGRQYVTMKAPTPTQASVAGSATSVTILAANTGRLGATITNDSSAVLYLKLGATASTSSYTVTLAGNTAAPFSYYEVPFGYTGVIDGIWASAAGNARITELT